MEVSGSAAACKCFAANVAFLHGWNDSGTQGLSKVQSSGGRRFPCSQTQLEAKAGMCEARFPMDFGENTVHSAIWTVTGCSELSLTIASEGAALEFSAQGIWLNFSQIPVFPV